MVKIRRSVFETNSSSTHSFCITKDNDYTIPEKVVFTIGEFGWEKDFLYTTEEKASYLYTVISEIYGQDYAKQFLFAALSEINIECDFLGDIRDGYVDHGYEAQEFVDAITHNIKRLCRFLFSARSFIRTGNDNDDEDVDINVDYSHEEYYKGN